MRIGVKLLGISEAVLLVAVLLLILPVRAKMKTQVVEQMRNELTSIAVNAAPLLSGTAHRLVEQGGETGDQAFRSLREILIAIRDLNEILGAEFADEQSSLTLMPGDRVLLASDGLSEAMDEAGEQLGMEPIVEAVVDRSIDCETVIRRLRETLDAHCGGPSQTDDVTILCVDRVETHPIDDVGDRSPPSFSN